MTRYIAHTAVPGSKHFSYHFGSLEECEQGKADNIAHYQGQLSDICPITIKPESEIGRARYGDGTLIFVERRPLTAEQRRVIDAENDRFSAEHEANKAARGA